MQQRDAAAAAAAAEGSNGGSGDAAASQLAELRMRGSGEASTSAAAAADGSAPAAADPQQQQQQQPAVSQSRASSAIRVRKFHALLSEPVVDLDALRELAWSGVPPELRPVCWRLLLGYLPPSRARQAAALARKRREYAEMVPGLYDIANSERSPDEVGALRQVAVDVPRTAPGVALFQHAAVQKALERVLYIWGIRHPASGYVQGMNDLATPFLAVFLSEALGGAPVWADGWAPPGAAVGGGAEGDGAGEGAGTGAAAAASAALLPEAALLEAEADTYWCLCKLLEGIQDHYTYAQPGIQRSVFRLKELVRKQHEALAAHMEAEGADFLQFAFRWVNCLLVREVPLGAALRLWDTYLAEGPRLPDFLVYACAAFLARWERPLAGRDFQELMLFLQRPPTQAWGDAEVESVLSAAYVLRSVWGGAQSHLQA